MRFLSVAAVCLIATTGFAQPPQPGATPPGRLPMQTPAITQSSRVRAFNARSDGQIHSVYLANGSVIDLSSSFGPDLNSQIHKGTRIRVVGSGTVVSGQSIIVPQQLTIGQQTFTATPNPGPGLQAGMTPPPDRGPGMPPPPAGNDQAGRGLGSEPARAGMPPPPALPGTPPPPARPGAPGVPPPPPAGLNDAGQPQPQPGRGPITPEQQRGNARRNAPSPPPNVQPLPPGGSTQPPAPIESTQPAPAPPSSPNL